MEYLNISWIWSLGILKNEADFDSLGAWLWLFPG